ncbi:chemotaxis protein CheD [Roseisalinus antarcticus]|uniref:Probable chemoreceptor glutamine deamidase CheD n=1 Tax=Roseisalinus antarcticus TaxID=254357 RepID=A0A1Y5SJ48_9RHOB|nr:chemotaxis protein CheD [Roseisalinus antarcticus]SLN39025.1 Chemoreceptor glutamine deamidase CheD [Roseisalinus antarcticus]
MRPFEETSDRAADRSMPPDAGGRTITVIQGDLAISADPKVTISTVLGSCVAVCMFEENVRIGGMNHFLLPGEGGGNGTQRYGVHLMELLINGLLKAGASRARLRAKIFGGARMSDNLRDIGRGNVDFAQSFLLREGIPILSEHVGGRQARRLKFNPTTGAVQQLLVSGIEDVAAAPPPRPVPKPDITLF